MAYSLSFKLDFRQHEPIYAQIVAHVKQSVATGSLRPGDQLPTVRQLAADLRVNFNTVARAYRMLDEEGIISTQQGRGTYILEQPHPVDQRTLRHDRLAALAEAFVYEARRLDYSPADIREALEAALGIEQENSGKLRN